MILSAQSIRGACFSLAPCIWFSEMPEYGDRTKLRADRHYLNAPLLSPFFERTRHEPSNTSYGLSAAGYDIRLDLESLKDDPKICTLNMRGLEPGEFFLASTIESFCMPNMLIGFVKDKSSLARRGISVFNTVAEPGWAPKEPDGLNTLTLEIVNHGRETVILHHGQGIAQVVFQLLDRPTDQPYGPGEKYSGQGRGPVAAR